MCKLNLLQATARDDVITLFFPFYEQLLRFFYLLFCNINEKGFLLIEIYFLNKINKNEDLCFKLSCFLSFFHNLLKSNLVYVVFIFEMKMVKKILIKFMEKNKFEICNKFDCFKKKKFSLINAARERERESISSDVECPINF